MTPKPLTPRQREMLLFLVDFQRQHGYPPSIRDIQTCFKIKSPNGVLCNLRALTYKGWIAVDRKTARAIRILHYPLPLFRPRGGELVYAGDVCVQVNGEEDDERSLG